MLTKDLIGELNSYSDFEKDVTITFPEEDPSSEFKVCVTEIFAYATAQQTAYLTENKSMKSVDIDLTPDLPETFRKFSLLRDLGEEMTLYFANEYQSTNLPSFQSKGNNKVTGVWYENKRVYINQTQYFEPVEEEIWYQQSIMGGEVMAPEFVRQFKNKHLTQSNIRAIKQLLGSQYETARLRKRARMILDMGNKEVDYCIFPANYLDRNLKKLPENLENFYEEIHYRLNTVIIEHIRYADKFLFDNNLPSTDTKTRRMLALELVALAYGRILAITCTHEIAMEQLIIVFASLLHNFNDFSDELKERGIGGVWLFFKKRYRELGDSIEANKGEFVTLENETNIRRIYITEPFAEINHSQKLPADENIERASGNVEYFSQMFNILMLNIGELEDKHIPRKKSEITI